MFQEPRDTTSPAAAQAVPTVTHIPYRARKECEHSVELAEDKALRANAITPVEPLARPPIDLPTSSMDIVQAALTIPNRE